MRRTCVVATSILIILALLVPYTGRVAARTLPDRSGATLPAAMKRWQLSTVLFDQAALGDAQRPSVPQRAQAEPVASEPEQFLVITRAISIPYGFNSPLILNSERQTVAVSGPGACTAGQQVTIEVSITQEQSGAMAAGQTEVTCTGTSGGWTIIAMASPGPRLAPGPAHACGVATTHDGATETDRQEWCRDIMLYVAVYLPLIQNSESYTAIWATSGIPI